MCLFAFLVVGKHLCSCCQRKYSLNISALFFVLLAKLPGSQSCVSNYKEILAHWFIARKGLTIFNVNPMKCFCAYRCLSAKPDSQAADALSLIFAVIKLRCGRKLTTVLIIKLTWEAYNTVTCEHKPCYIRRVPPFLSTFAITNGSKPYRVCLIGCKGESETTGSPMGA